MLVTDITAEQRQQSLPLSFFQFPMIPMPALTPFQPMLDLYQIKRGSRQMPKWRDFHFSDFIGWHSRVAVSERDGDDLRFRIFGSTFTELFARDLTGQLLAASMRGDQYHAILAHFRRCCDGPMIGCVSGNVPVAGRDFVAFQVVDLPLADDTGEVTHFLHVTTTNGGADMPL